MDEATLAALRALVDSTRIRIYARLLETPADAGALAAALGLSPPAVNRSLEALVAAGLIDGPAVPRGPFTARPDRVGALGRALADARRRGWAVGPGADNGDTGDGPAAGLGLRGAWPHDGEPPADTAARLGLAPGELATLRAYLVDGRLTTIPAQLRKRHVILRFLLERVFVEDRDYPEKEVNQRLALFHPDVASLRRDLVDLGYASRDAGRYRRRGPRPAPDPLPGG